MGSGASADVTKAVSEADAAGIKAAVDGLPADQRDKVISALGLTNGAFVFIKPHACTDKVKELTKKHLEDNGIKIVQEGELDGATIDEKKLIDNHYYAIAVKATLKKPNELNVPNDKFKAQFEKDWQEVLDSGNVFNALDGCQELGCDSDGMADAWNKAKDEKKLVKLGGGFYCGYVTVGEKSAYIMNGFFMQMRGKFTKKEAKLQYYSVEWDSTKLSWADFRAKVLGPTDPAAAPEASLRGQIFKNWKDLGLEAEPNTGDNGAHGSASPFEGLAERNNWLGVKIEEDLFGKQLLAGGVKPEMIDDWKVDPQVNIEAEKKGSIFDALEDQNVTDCLKTFLDLVKLN